MKPNMPTKTPVSRWLAPLFPLEVDLGAEPPDVEDPPEEPPLDVDAEPEPLEVIVAIYANR